ncbi:mechanosensitive ion channel family protein [Arthrobacter sp. CG_A4]|uniref:mechanosensitive ion channel family protein n=1 Tax=Arthrobacter sp. CG_A4 TaxID=3071706 RepID=UPI002E15470D
MTTTAPITPPDMSAINLPGVLISIGVGVTVWLVASFVIAGITKRVAAGTTFFKKPHFRWVAPALRALDHERRVQRANTIGALLNSVVGVLVAVLTIMYVLSNLNVNIAPLLTSVGILGIAIGFGAQQLIRDFLAGLFITIEDQYGIGDIIETSEVVGTVESMNLRITRVRAEDGTIWYLRNGEILRVGNRSQGTYVPPAPDQAGTDSVEDTEETREAREARDAGAPRQKAGE